jgi:hypothetical protein
MFCAALFAGAAAWAISRMAPPLHPLPLAAGVMAIFGALYFIVARMLGIDEAMAFWQGLTRRFARRRG